MISTHSGRSYSTRSHQIDGKYRVDFVMRCAGCGHEGSIHMDPNCAPALIVKKFVRLGWAANERNEKGCYCPACMKSEKPQMPVQAEMPKGPTLDQMKRIAEHVRGAFEPDAGHYLDGATDHTVGDKLGLPWGWVRQVREMLGYEIKIDPEVKAIRDELAALADMCIALERRLNALERKRAA